MRGKVIFGCFCRFPMRITPAYAGKRCKPEKRQDCRQDHPRLCGEKVPMAIKLYLLVGITPAYAGKSSRCATWLVSMKDHPRLCGEKNADEPYSQCTAGSPPPMRGKAHLYSCNAAVCRITPAYAGKRCCWHRLPKEHWDHPRLCGEKCRLYAMQTAGTGSPPPMRGKELTFGRSAPRSRITPAYAGKSSYGGRTRFPCRDHPRLCGEKPRSPAATGTSLGSPPPMRGKELLGLLTVKSIGITPAYAGKRFSIR